MGELLLNFRTGRQSGVVAGDSAVQGDQVADHHGIGAAFDA
jgi:hypothetical protein